jgi:hypothetical protein
MIPLGNLLEDFDVNYPIIVVRVLFSKLTPSSARIIY